MSIHFIGHNCGLVVSHDLHDGYSICNSLQSRGKDATGIAAIGDNKIIVIKWRGPVKAFAVDSLYKMLPEGKFHTFLWHVRYKTSGHEDKLLEMAHPHTIGGTVEHRGSHIIITNPDAVLVHNGEVDVASLKIDTTRLKTNCDTEALLHYIHQNGITKLLQQIPGSYTLAYHKRGDPDIIIARDPIGMKPGVIGMKDRRYCIASENSAIIKAGGKEIDTLTPGAYYRLLPHGEEPKRTIVNIQPVKQFCAFEFEYFARPDSSFNGKQVYPVRRMRGKILAERFGQIIADYVTYLPQCPEDAAREFSLQTHMPFLEVFYKQTTDRAFLGPSANDRKNAITKNLYLIPEIAEKIRDKTILIIDDSVVRGNNAKYAGLLVKNIVKKAILLSYTPIIGSICQDGTKRGCSWGVAMPPDDKFVSRADDRNATPQEINAAIGMETHFVSFEDQQEGFRRCGIDPSQLCLFCTGGQHPFKHFKKPNT